MKISIPLLSLMCLLHLQSCQIVNGRSNSRLGNGKNSVKNGSGKTNQLNGKYNKRLTVTLSRPMNNLFHTLKKKHNWQFQNANDEASRRMIFKNNHKKIRTHNARFANGLETYRLGHNKFSTMSFEEFKAIKTGLVIPRINKQDIPEFDISVDSVFNSSAVATARVLPPSVNWTAVSGVVTPVKNQGNCGDCWAFSSTGSLEGQWMIKNGVSVNLSEQQLLDCTYKRNGCNGGFMTQAFAKVKKIGGIEPTTSYPDDAKYGPCTFQLANVVAQVTGSVNVNSNGNEAILQAAVAAVGPISIAVDVEKDLQFYKSGIFHSKTCRNELKDLSHAVLATGYGTESGVDFWIVKNSWGTAWGEEGYIRIRRNFNNLCGIATIGVYPTVPLTNING